MDRAAGRPPLDENLSLDDFRSFYWWKEELAAFCRARGIPTAGAKGDLAARIEQFLTGVAIAPPPPRPTPKKRGNTPRQPLTLDTVIPADYTNSQAHRAFFLAVIGPSFHFTTRFMRFCREHAGTSTYREAVAEWHQEQAERKSGAVQTEIGPQFQYNRYIRDFLQDNPDKSFRDAVTAWNRKKLERGDQRYEAADVADR